jgi:transposase
MFTIPKNVAKHSFQHSWFSIKHFSSDSTNELPVKSILPSLEDGNTSNFKTIKLVLKPNSKQTKKLFDSMNLWSWYYNASISILYNNKENLNSIKLGNKYSYEKGRDLLYHYYYDKSNSEKFVKKQNNEEKSIPLPYGRKSNTIHSRLPRGAVKLFVSNLNSSHTLHKGNLSNVTFQFKSKKSNNKNLLYFEDKSYPKWINEIKGYYKDNNNKKISFEKIRKETQNRSITIQYDNIKNKFFMYWPVDKEVFETQEHIFYRPIKKTLPIIQSNIVAIDPGIRTFCTSYCSKGNVTEICNENQYLYKYHKQIINYKENKAKTVFNKFLNTKKNKNIDKKILKIYKCMRNKVDDLHWKSINILSQLGKTILYPSFHVKQMLMQENFPDNIKRVMSSLSFYKFKNRLKNKLEKRVIIVSERLSSKTCYNCGHVNKELGSSKVYDCKTCKVCIPRDWNGSVNILKMNTELKTNKIKGKQNKETSAPLKPV